MGEPIPDTVSAFLAALDPMAAREIKVLDAADAASRPYEAAYKIAVFKDDDGRQYRIYVDQPAISAVVIDLNSHHVVKKIRRFAECGILLREIAWLRALAGSGVVPALVAVEQSELKLRYVGEPVRQYNLPGSWSEQAEAILVALETVKCRHNDIKCDNLTVLDDRLYLIDFGWATGAGDTIPTTWPEGIGRQHRRDIHVFDDRHAIYAALRSAERNEVDRSILLTEPAPGA
jgi:hypothetical protein